MDPMPIRYDAVALFSGGLDSILAARVAADQGLRVKCLHFVSPFFGKPDKIARWSKLYGLDIEAADIGEAFTAMLAAGPAHGVGKTLNPCLDCKILMIRLAVARMAELGATMVISGEVLGQRPMSQRRDAMDVVRRDAGAAAYLVRPLCAGRLEPSPPELDGRIDRSRLLSLYGRGRREQLALAARYGLTEIPTPAGGCLLAEHESAKRYWPVIKFSPAPQARDFDLANIGRQYWAEGRWMAIGRNQSDNQAIEACKQPSDIAFKVIGYPGPLGLGRQFSDSPWSADDIKDAAAFFASFSPKARVLSGPVKISVSGGPVSGAITVPEIGRTRLDWRETLWETVREEKRRAFPHPGQGEPFDDYS